MNTDKANIYSMLDFSIIIPAYNEANIINDSLTQVINFMSDYNPHFEVIVVDDGSLDKTVELVESYAGYHSEVRVIKNNHFGKAQALISGFKAAQGRYVLMADADMATPISELKRFMLWIEEYDMDVVYASREGVGATRHKEPFYRHFVGRVFNLTYQLIILPGVKDAQCGFKLFKKEVIDDIVSHLVVYAHPPKNLNKPFFGAFDIEILFLARHLGYKSKELPVEWYYVPTTRFSFISNSYKMLLDVLKIRFTSLTGKYAVVPKVEEVSALTD
ncbi:MAG: glycosyltransferase [Patescibacteria group bacterium]|uniref:Glycosyltransferase n=1 Tax=candidate division WWE3 bacterium TaxID=2053526 RepID=A0A955EC66_UNCKA|nr:glycosyltransferase [candidate division WWE3 bacterium]